MRTLPINFAILQGIGLWQPTNSSSLLASVIYRLYTFSVMFAVLLNFVTRCIDMILTGKSLMDFANVGSRLLSSAFMYAKMCSILLSRKRIIDILETLETDPCLPRNAEEMKIQEKHNRNVRNKTIKYGIVGNLAIFMILSHAIRHAIPARKLPRRAWFPYDVSHGVMYWISCLHQVITLFYLYIAGIGCDTLVCGFFLEISTKLNILRYRFMNLHNTYEEELTHGKFEAGDILRIERKLITDCVNYHLCLMDLAERINSTFSLIIFTQYVKCTTLICLSVYYISGMELNAGIFYVIFYLFVLLYQIFLYCDCADGVIIESEKIAESVHAMNWMRFSRTTWKSILIIGYQSSHPIILRSGHFVTLSLESFKSLIQVTYSAFNALKTM